MTFHDKQGLTCCLMTTRLMTCVFLREIFFELIVYFSFF